VLERLGEVAEGQPVRGERRLCLRAQRACLEDRRPGHLVDREQPVEAAHVEGEHARPSVMFCGQAADDGGATAERHQGDPVVAAPADDRGHLLVVPGSDDDVRSVATVTCAHPQQVGSRLAAGVPDPGLVVGVHVRGAEHAAELLEQVLGQRHLGQPDLVQRDRRARSRRAEDRLDQITGGTHERLPLGRVAPPGPVHRGHLCGHCVIV
jgi:hypothetical protein